MTPLIVTLALSAALLHAVWNAMAKSGTNPVFNIAAYQLASSLICVLLLPFVQVPAQASWVFILASTAIHTLYYFSLARTYQSGDLSHVYPIFRGLAPILVVVGAMIFVGEHLSTGGIIGVCIISLGIMSLALSKSQNGGMSPQALRWAITTSMLIAMYTVVDGLGVRASAAPMGYIIWLFAVESIPVVTILLLTQRSEWLTYIRGNPTQIIFGGVASTVAYGMVIFAMSFGAMAIVSSLRETSVIFATLIGAFFLKEPFDSKRIRAAIFVVVGILVMRLW